MEMLVWFIRNFDVVVVSPMTQTGRWQRKSKRQWPYLVSRSYLPLDNQLDDEQQKPELDGREGVDEGQRGGCQNRVTPLPGVAHGEVDVGEVAGIPLGDSVSIN